MRILIAPDDFKGTLSAPEAAAAIAAGWRRTRPDADLLERPVSDGGAGFVYALASARGVPLRTVNTSDAFGRPIAALWCLDGGTAYIEAAQVVGLHLGCDIRRASSAGVGGVVAAAVRAGAHTVVVGLGGTNVNDAGAGMLGALGAIAHDVTGASIPLDAGPSPLAGVATVDLSAPAAVLAGVELIVATDVDVPLLGPRGATYGFAGQKGAAEADLEGLEGALAAFARACGRRDDGRDAAVALGAGAAGGLGFALMRIGATRVPGIEYVLAASRLDLHGVDLVVTGEGCLDWQSMRGKAVSGVAAMAQAAGVPTIALAGRIDITARERSEMGLDGAYSVSELVGAEASFADPAQALTETAARVARTWG